MANEALKLFYSYAPKDEPLRKKLDDHLALLKREGLISDWHHKKIRAGEHYQEEIDQHLQSAHIILLLISPYFLASDYCYSTEVQAAMKRSQEGTACVVPILLRPCDWKTATFADLQAFPRNGRAIVLWDKQDAAFTEIAKEIRDMIYKLNGHPDSNAQPQTNATNKQQRSRTKRETEELTMIGPSERPKTPPPPVSLASLSATTLKKAIDCYYRELRDYEGKADHELAVRSAFQNLLAETARMVNWTLIPEQTIEGGLRPDGVLRDSLDLYRGYWEAKSPKSDLKKEIEKKKAVGYPLINTIFENTKIAILYQNKQPYAVTFDLSKPNDVSDLLQLFLHYTEPDTEHFESALQDFKERIPEHAQATLKIIADEHKLNKKFIAAFQQFTELCRASLDPKIDTATIDEMLVQHLLTERLFRTVFDNPDFVSRNVIASEIEKVIQALRSRAFNRLDFLKELDRFYFAVEAAAKSMKSWSERQHFLNMIYERFFQGFAVKQADTYGIVYTPPEIVDFMCESVNEVLKKDFGTSLEEPDVQILDPATGTGSFMVNLVHRIKPHKLKYKYQHDLFCNEIMLLPYYIASLNIEHEYYVKMGAYEPFEGICFADTLELAEGQQLSLFVEENTERVKREKEAQIMVVIGNPPYNVGQRSENDNNKNRKYPHLDQRIRETYAKDSKASNKNALFDAYVRFFRWATDRLQGRDGIVCFISNNGFLDGLAFDGLRKQLAEEFTSIYHLNLLGNARKGESGNVFDIMVGVGITLAIRSSSHQSRHIWYACLPKQWSKEEKLAFLRQNKHLTNVEWGEIQPNKEYMWLTEGLKVDFSTFIPLGIKTLKGSLSIETPAIFSRYGNGVKTNRDTWAYDFDQHKLTDKIKILIDQYNIEVDRWRRRGIDKTAIDDFVRYDDTKIKWSRDLKLDLQRGNYAQYDERKIRTALYRPFCKKYLFFDRILNEEVYQFPQILPNAICELENIVICVPGLGNRKGFGCLATNCIASLDLAFEKVQCFPYYTYAEDGTNRRENITDWARQQFQDRYGSAVTKWDIFYYIYAMLHHPHYREHYAENLKRDLPHLPLLLRYEAFLTCVQIGKQLMDLHLNYEQAKEYPLQWILQEGEAFSWRVERMKLTADKAAVIVNESLTLAGIPQECFAYQLANRSALEWVIDQYQMSKDARSGIECDPNCLDDEEYIVRLIGKVVTVSIETVRLIHALAQTVTIEYWVGEGSV